MLSKLFNRLMDLGVVHGMTFKLEQQEGVGMFIVPNATPNRMQPQARVIRNADDVSGTWIPKPWVDHGRANTSAN